MQAVNGSRCRVYVQGQANYCLMSGDYTGKLFLLPKHQVLRVMPYANIDFKEFIYRTYLGFTIETTDRSIWRPGPPTSMEN